MYISYKLDAWSKDLNTDFTLSNCIFGAVKLAKNIDPDKYKYSGIDIGFDRISWIYVIIFEVNNSFVHFDGRNKNILVLCEGPTQGLEDVTIAAESEYPINFTE